MLAVEPREPGARLLLVGDAVERDRNGSAVPTRLCDRASVP
jgi:hypothetical protein